MRPPSEALPLAFSVETTHHLQETTTNRLKATSHHFVEKMKKVSEVIERFKIELLRFTKPDTWSRFREPEERR